VPLAPGTADRLVAEAEGLPLAVVEYLQLLRSVDAQDVGEEWPIPSGLFEVVAGRLDALSETAGSS
jgi:hypothetical protein